MTTLVAGPLTADDGSRLLGYDRPPASLVDRFGLNAEEPAALQLCSMGDLRCRFARRVRGGSIYAFTVFAPYVRVGSATQQTSEQTNKQQTNKQHKETKKQRNTHTYTRVHAHTQHMACPPLIGHDGWLQVQRGYSLTEMNIAVGIGRAELLSTDMLIK